MRLSSFRAASIALMGLAAACSGTDPGIFGQSSGTGDGTGGGTGEGGTGSSQSSGPGTTTSASTASSGDGGDGGGGPGPGSSGATTSTSSSSDGGGGSASSVASSSVVTTGEAVSSTAAGPTCGDGQVNGTDDCDGSDLDGQTCVSLGFGVGSLACTDDCTFDPSGCSRCGNGDIDGNEDCDDGGLEPGDGCDAGCAFEGTSCDTPIEVEIDRGQIVTISTTNQGGDSAPGNVCEVGPSGPGRVIRVRSTASGFLRGWVKRDQTTFDSYLRIGYDCDDTFVCADSYDAFASDGDPPLAGGEVGALYVGQDQDTYVLVEAYSAGIVGDFEIELTLTRGRCDEPVVIPVEPGSADGIKAWGFNEGQGNDVLGTCGGSGEDIAYRLEPMGVASVDLRLEVVQSLPFNPVLHVRSGICGAPEDQVACASSNGFGQTESINDLPIGDDFVFADATANSDGGYVLRIVPPPP